MKLFIATRKEDKDVSDRYVMDTDIKVEELTQP